jgi:hypothetical protein
MERHVPEPRPGDDLERIRPEFLAECQLSVANTIIESAAADAASSAVPGPRLDEARGLFFQRIAVTSFHGLHASGGA